MHLLHQSLLLLLAEFPEAGQEVMEFGPGLHAALLFNDLVNYILQYLLPPYRPFRATLAHRKAFDVV